MGEPLPMRWQRLLDGLDEATGRRAPARTAEPTSAPGGLDLLEAARYSVHEAWLSAPELFEALDLALTELSARMPLTPFETDLLAATLAADIDPAFASALDALSPGPRSSDRPAVAPILEVLGAPNVHPAVRRALGPGGRLHRTGLLRLRGSGPFLGRHPVLPDRVVTHFLGDPEPDSALEFLLVRPEPLDLPGSERVAALWATGQTLIWVTGAQSTAGVSMAAGAGRRLERPCLAVDLSRVHSSERLDRLDAAILEAVLQGAALIVTGLFGSGPLGGGPETEPSAGLATGSGDGPTPADLVHRLSQTGIAVAVVAAESWDPDWAPWLPPTLIAPRLDPDLRRALWQAHIDPERPSSPEIWRDLIALHVTPEEISRVAALAQAEAGGPPGPQDLVQAARRLADRAGAARRSGVTLDDLVLPPQTRSELDGLVSWVRNRDQVLAQGPLTGKGKGRGIAALFAGGPGTGKTYAAQAVAGTLGLDLYQVDLTSVVDKYIGESEKRLSRVFATAERLNCILFFDEADALFGTRSSVQDAHDRYANIGVSYLLQRLEEFDGVVVLATNLRGNLDSAFTRRLHFVLHFPDPDDAARAQLWRTHLGHLAETDPDDPVDVEKLAAAADIAGGSVRNAVLTAAFTAFEDNGGRVGQRHLTAALDRELRKLGRRGVGPG
ncbi:MAG TPA: AAA family ATPase [Kineosporiaceae bacterium]|nr:AAA family ATPase [Kineosporiaceae bacterium]